MDITSLIVQLISGAVGGNIGGALLKQYSLGTVGNSIAGIVGGGIGGQIISALMGGGGAAATSGIGAILGNVAGGGVGGIIVMIIVGLIRNMMGNKPAS